jgi:iron complex outermembrane receptor protein
MRQASGNLNPLKNFLDNLGEITANGFDAKVEWLSSQGRLGHFSASLQATVVNNYEAVDIDGAVAQRQLAVEIDNSAIPKLQANMQLAWGVSDREANWTVRYIDSVTEACANITRVGVPGRETRADFQRLGTVMYHDVQVAWTNALRVKGLKLSLGANNEFGKAAPICYSCTLNDYDAGTYDLPWSFWNLTALRPIAGTSETSSPE